MRDAEHPQEQQPQHRREERGQREPNLDHWSHPMLVDQGAEQDKEAEELSLAACDVCTEPVLHELTVEPCGHGTFHADCLLKRLAHRSCCSSCAEMDGSWQDVTSVNGLAIAPVDVDKAVQQFAAGLERDMHAYLQQAELDLGPRLQSGDGALGQQERAELEGRPLPVPEGWQHMVSEAEEGRQQGRRDLEDCIVCLEPVHFDLKLVVADSIRVEHNDPRDLQIRLQQLEGLSRGDSDMKQQYRDAMSEINGDCEHTFHIDCLLQHFSADSRCPACMKQISELRCRKMDGSEAAMAIPFSDIGPRYSSERAYARYQHGYDLQDVREAAQRELQRLVQAAHEQLAEEQRRFELPPDSPLQPFSRAHARQELQRKQAQAQEQARLAEQDRRSQPPARVQQRGREAQGLTEEEQQDLKKLLGQQHPLLRQVPDSCSALFVLCFGLCLQPTQQRRIRQPGPGSSCNSYPRLTQCCADQRAEEGSAKTSSTSQSLWQRRSSTAGKRQNRQDQDRWTQQGGGTEWSKSNSQKGTVSRLSCITLCPCRRAV
jgi:hypothetical protein